MEATALPAAATLIALAFAFATGERWLDTRARHHAAWTTSLGFFAAGSAALWAGAAFGWSGPIFRAFYLFGAIVNVPILALGTIYLLTSRPVADRIAAGIGLVLAFAAGVVVVAPLTAPVPADALPKGSDVFGVLPRVLAATASGAGALVLFGGAVTSSVSALRGRSRPRLAVGNLFIAAGTVVLSLGGLFNSVVGEMDAFAVSLVLGAGLLFVGFLVASPAPSSAVPARLRSVSADEPRRLSG